MDKLRRQRVVLRGAVTRLLKAAIELLQAPSSSPHDLQEAIDELRSKDALLKELNDKIGELLEGEEFEQEYTVSLAYQGSICRGLSRLRSALNDGRATGIRAAEDAR